MQLDNLLMPAKSNGQNDIRVYMQSELPRVILIRGCPGSGKSTTAARIRDANPGTIVVSTDDYWFVVGNGTYDYRPALLRRAHNSTFHLFCECIEKGKQLVVVDNTNVTIGDMKRYVLYARQLGYQIEFIEPSSPWAFDPEELSRRNIHNVPKVTIERMLKRYDHNVTLEKVLSTCG